MKTNPQPEPKSKGSAVGGFIVLIIIVLVVLGVIANISPSSENTENDTVKTATSTEAGAAIAQARQATIDKVSPQYCEKRQATKVTLSESGVAEGWPSNDGSGWTNEECVTIISKLYDAGATEEELLLVTDNKYAIGMLEMSLLYSLGSPSDINRTQFSGYTSAQYVYGTTYIYAENGKVTSVQN